MEAHDSGLGALEELAMAYFKGNAVVFQYFLCLLLCWCLVGFELLQLFVLTLTIIVLCCRK